MFASEDPAVVRFGDRKDEIFSFRVHNPDPCGVGCDIGPDLSQDGLDRGVDQTTQLGGAEALGIAFERTRDAVAEFFELWVGQKWRRLDHSPLLCTPDPSLSPVWLKNVSARAQNISFELAGRCLPDSRSDMKISMLTTAFVLISIGSSWSQSAPGEPDTSAEVPRAIPLKPEDKKLKPGEFAWHPERSPEGPLLVVCTIDDQMLYAYRNGVEIARSTVSTGRKGKTTPTGVFTILQRRVDHESSIYKGAKMPYMQRLTWTGIAMHAGKLPGYPASAGCIRLPYDFSKLIFGEMQNGSTVVITNKKSTPSKSATPASILMKSEVRDPVNKSTPKGEVVWEPKKSLHGPISILLSYADKTVYVWRNGVQIGQSPVDFNSEIESLPEGVFLMLDGEEPADPKLPGITIHPGSVLSLTGNEVKGDIVKYMRESFSLPPEFRASLNKELHPGTILLATSESSTEETRSGAMAIGVPDQEEEKAE